MKRTIYIFLFLICFPLLVIGAKDKDQNTYRYEMEGVDETAYNSSQIAVKVWSYGKIEKITRETCMRNAVHGVIFKGVPASTSNGLIQGRRAIVPDGYEAHKEYFDRFFESGDYLQYVELINNGDIRAGDRIKLSNKEYKIGMICLINIEALNARLVKDNVAMGLRL